MVVVGGGGSGGGVGFVARDFVKVEEIGMQECCGDA